MHTDRFDNGLTTASAQARDSYVAGVDLFLGANGGAIDAFERAVEHDRRFALARAHQVRGDGRSATTAIGEAEALAATATPREQGHIAVVSDLIAGNGAAAFDQLIRHTDQFPRDAMIVQPATGVFGLIGFSGRQQREAEQLAFMERLAPHYGDDWWFSGQYAFAEVEAGQIKSAEARIARSLDGNPRNANSAHIKAHIHYEQGEAGPGLAYLTDWAKDYERDGTLHCHVNWHLAIWNLEQGDTDRAFQILRNNVAPGSAWGPPLNVMTDAAAFLFRADLAGVPVDADLWRKVSDYAAAFFPNPGIAFADVHAALAHAMAGHGEPLERIIHDAKGPAADVVAPVAEAFAAFAKGEYARTVGLLQPLMSQHERIGGSRAQRDLIEYTLLAAMLRLGRSDEAQRHLLTSRPCRSADRANPVTMT